MIHVSEHTAEVCFLRVSSIGKQSWLRNKSTNCQ